MIKLESIVKIYNAGDSQVKALDNVSINFREQEFVSILGPSGCGKTTLLNILGGLDRYTSGNIEINGVSTKNYKDRDWDTYRNHHIGFVFQSYNLIPHLSIRENVELALSIGGTSKSERKKKALNALERVGLKEQAKKKPSQLSGGQMQRVAIARAIVNNPKIILADEPTGALDSGTSRQVMDILKEISKEHLVIVVTHNKELADTYSDRTINLLDGRVVSDSKPFDGENELLEQKGDENEEVTVTEENNTAEQKAKKKPKKRKSAMSIFTAFALSFKNLISKKTKTLLVSFAGSIGIIGIALVLAVSTGMNNYVANLQSEALSGYPVVVSTVAIDYDAIQKYLDKFMDMVGGDSGGESEPSTPGGGGTGGGGGPAEPVYPDKSLSVYDMTRILGKIGKYNYLSNEFITYMNDYYTSESEKNKEDRDLQAMKVEYSTNLRLYTKVKGEIVQADTSTSKSSLTGVTQSMFFEGLNNSDYVLSNYKVVYGHYPRNANELCLVINSQGNFSVADLNKMGIEYTENANGSITDVKYSQIVGKEYKLLYNDEYFIADNDENPTEFKYRETVTEEVYNNPNNETLKISGIIEVKENVSSDIFSAGIMYLPELTQKIIQTNRESKIAQATLNNKKLYVPFKLDIKEVQQFLGKGDEVFEFKTPQEIVAYVKSLYRINITIDDAIELGLQMIGASKLPTAVYLYSNSFDAKQAIMDTIKEWNETDTGKNYPIAYTDSTSFLSSTLGTLIDVISYVLIAFAAISLVVSSIMIGIITYTSVIERTKEIGVLRSIGARKVDISRVFNMETFIIGLTAGVIGVVVTFILTFPISSLIQSLAGGVITTRLAVLKVTDMLILVAISVVLTLIAGLIPAIMAAKKDPVKALRSE